MGMPAIHRGDEAAKSIAASLGSAGRTEGSNPGNAPQCGLTHAGVVEAFIEGTLGQSSLTPNPGPLPTAFMPTAPLKGK
jgi:hypothetical protein